MQRNFGLRLLPLLALFLCSPSMAAILRVKADAPGPAHDGATWDTAYTSVSAALTSATSGDEVWVARGTYLETLKPTKSVSLYGGFEGNETGREERNWRVHKTVLDASAQTLTLPAVQFTTSGATGTLDGFTVTGGTDSGVRCGGDATVVRNCVVSGNRRGGVSCVHGAATLANNNVTGNSGGGITSGGTVLAAVNNTVTENTGTALSIHGGSATVVNCILAFNGAGITRYAGEQVDLRHNDVYGNIGYQYGGNLAGYGAINGNLSVDPRVASPYTMPHLQPDSPCIDAGDDSVVADGDVDIDGQPRIQGSHVDIGADESDGTTWPADTRILHVSTAGDDGGDGLTWQTARKTVGAAVADAHGGDELWVAEGIYAEGVSLPAGIALYGGFAGGETRREDRDWRFHPTTLDTNRGGTVVSANFKDIVVDGFTLRNAFGSGVRSDGGNVTIANNDIHGNAFGGIYGSGAHLTVLRNAIHGNRSNRDAGLYVSGGSVTMTGNVIRKNEAVENGDGGGLWCNGTAVLSDNSFTDNDGGRYGGGIYWFGGNATLTNNTLTGNSATNGGAVCVENGRFTLHNNIIASNTPGVFREGLAFVTPDSSNNDVYGNTGYDFSGLQPLTGSNGNISVDPLLISVDDVPHLSADSLCIDAGNDAVVMSGDLDIDGQPRIQGSHVDIGADEFSGSPNLLADALRALRIAAGLNAATTDDATRLDVDASHGVDVLDAALLARHAAGLGTP